MAAARGVTPEAFDGFDPRAYLPTAAADAADRSLDALVVHNRKSAKTHSGIWRDLAVRKRPTEVDAQLGIVVSLGAAAGVPAPITAQLVSLVHDIEQGRRPMSLETLDVLAATASRARLRMTFDFTGQTVIVTGAAHGFGRVIALAFASRGAHVWACDIVADELQVTERLCAQMRGSCTTRVVDVRDKTRRRCLRR